MAVQLDQFIHQTVESGLISSADLTAFIEGLPPDRRPADAQQLARELVRQKKLTAFQAQQIYAGRGKQLVLGNYVVLDKLGQGGMGMVLKAEHRRMERMVALKVLSPNVTKTAEASARFQREVKAAARLNHTNIVTAYDADEAGGTHFLVMEYVEGTDLSSLVKTGGTLPVDKALSCILQAARGLEYAHGQGVVHRDIKPANLLLDAQGTIKILDMGLARLDSAGAQQDELTGTGQIMGTVDYMAPEQAQNTRLADARADIYSLGITLWYLLTGKPAYTGETVIEKLLAHRDQPIPELSDSCEEVSPQLNAIFARMVAKTPEERYPSMSEVIADLEACRGGASASMPNISAGPGDDSRLNAFLGRLGQGEAGNSIVGKPGSSAVHAAHARHSATGAPDVTINTGAPQIGTDPHTDQSISAPAITAKTAAPKAATPVKRGTARPSTAAKSTGWRQPWVAAVAGAGLGGVLLLVLGVWMFSGGREAGSPPRLGRTNGENGDSPPVAVGSWTPSAAQQAFFGQVAGLLPDQQVEAVTKKLGEVNPEFDGVLAPTVENGKVTGLRLTAYNLSDIWPLRAFDHLTQLTITRKSGQNAKLSDLAPLAGWRLTTFHCMYTSVSDLSPLAGMPLVELDCNHTRVSDLAPLAETRLTRLNCGDCRVESLSPLAALRLVHLDCGNNRNIRDLSPVRGMPLTFLDIASNSVDDLSPLAGMPLNVLVCSGTRVTDLSPLSRSPLTNLNCSGCDIADLSPVAGLPLTSLSCPSCRISDLSPLSQLRLTALDFSSNPVTDLRPVAGLKLTKLGCQAIYATDLSPLRNLPLAELAIDLPLFHDSEADVVRDIPKISRLRIGPSSSTVPTVEMWQAYQQRRLDVETFTTQTAQLPIDEQLAAITERLKKLNAAPEVTLRPVIEDGQIVELTVTLPVTGSHVSPLRALRGLRKLTIIGGRASLDLSPLNAAPLVELSCREPILQRNAVILQGIPTLEKVVALPDVGTYALEFDGVDDVVVFPTLRITSNSTCAIDVEIIPDAAGNDGYPVFGVAGGIELRLDNTLRLSFTMPQKDKPAVTIRADKPVRPGRPVHLSAAMGSGQMRLFVDGWPQTQTASITPIPQPDVEFRFGELAGAHFKGRLLALRVLDTSRTSIFRRPDYYVPSESTAALYEFNPVGGDVLRDISGHGNHGRIVGAKWAQGNDPPAAALGNPAPAGQPTPHEILTSPDWEWTQPVNLGAHINTTGADQTPTISGDGRTLIYFTYGKGSGTLCQATRPSADQPFGESVVLGPQLSREARSSSGTMTADGLTLVFLSEQSGGQGDLDLWQATRPTTSDPFSRPRNLVELNSPGREHLPTLSADGLTIFFRSDRPGASSTQNWISHRASLDAPFDKPQEFKFPVAPGMRYAHVAGLTMSADGRVLIFSPAAIGQGLGLVMSVRESVDEPFGEPEKLEFSFYKDGVREVEPTLSADGTVLVFNSTRPGGLGGPDLWQVRRVPKRTAQVTDPARQTDATDAGEPSSGAGALLFDGVDDRVEMPSLRYDGPSPITVEAWVVADVADRNMNLFRSDRLPGVSLYLQKTGSWSFAAFDGTEKIVRASPPGSARPGQLTHLAGTWDGRGEVVLYVDGHRVGEETRRPYEDQRTTPSSIAAQYDRDGQTLEEFFAGRILQLHVIAHKRYKSNFQPPAQFTADSDTLALYRFDEGSGNILHDASGNGHDGQIVGAKWVHADGTPMSPP